MKVKSFPIVSWTAILLLLEVAFGCPQFRDARCTCLDKGEHFNQTCYNSSSHKMVFQANSYESGGEYNVMITCQHGDSTDKYFEFPTLPSVLNFEIYNCILSERFLINISSFSIRNFYLFDGIYLDNNALSLLLRNQPMLKEIGIVSVTLENITADEFVGNAMLDALFLEGNSLKTLPAQVFSSLKELDSLSISHNDFSDLPGGLFSGLHKLKSLLISKNNLKSLRRDIFSHQLSLSDLNISGNKIETLPEDLFSQNTKLDRVILRENNLMTLPGRLLHKIENLTRLDISENPLTEIPKEFLKNQKRLKEFIANNCNLTSIPYNTFVDAKYVNTVNLKNNRLKTISSILFKSNNYLSSLDLSYNDLYQLNNSPFQFNPNLKRLDLKVNNLRVITSETFVGLNSLKDLDISNNSLVYVEKDSFLQLRALLILNMSNNELSEIPDIEIQKYISNFILDLNGNKIADIPNVFDFEMRELRLERNNISSIAFKRLSTDRKRVMDIYVQHNGIRTIDLTPLKFNSTHFFPSSLSVKVRLYLKNNPFVCDCHLFELFQCFSNVNFSVRYIDFPDALSLTCRDPEFLRGQRIIRVEQESFTCEFSQDCPERCVCTSRKLDGAVILDCRGGKLQNLPERIPENVRILDVRNNFLTDLGDLRGKQWQNLTDIYADGNSLSSGGSSHWFIPSTVQMLSLRGNLLSSLPDAVGAQADGMPTFRVDLANNSWACDCSGKELKSWLSKHSIQVKDINDILCLNETSGNWAQLVEIPDSLLCPVDMSPEMESLISVVLFPALLIIILLTCLVLYYRYKNTILAYIYTHFQCLFLCFYKSSELDKDKVFDAFISYGCDDREVTFQLITELEQKHPYYKLCIHERDWIPGNFITDNIMYSVECSRKTIFVLSKSYLKSSWFDIEFHAAYFQMIQDKMDRIIIVLKGDQPPKESLHKDLQYLLSTKTYLVWGEKWFWEKMRYSISKRFQKWSPSRFKRKSSETCVANEVALPQL